MDADQLNSGTRVNTAAHILATPSDQEALELERAASHPLALIPTLSRTREEEYSPLRRNVLRYWRRHISLAVPHVKCRDHLGEWLSSLASFLPACQATDNPRTQQTSERS